MLRDYQQAAVDAAKEWLLKCVEPALLDLTTGAGKSHIVAELARWLHEKSGKKVLCLAPSKELIIQNREKFLTTGNPASLFCAGAGGKELKHHVIFGSPDSVHRSLDKFGAQFGAIVIDECHRITSTVKKIIDHIKAQNPKVRVIGLTATPYRLNTGYIFGMFPDGSVVPEYSTSEPYFAKCLYRVTAQYLIDNGYLTQPHADPDHMEGYDTSNLQLNKLGKFDAVEVDRAFVGKGRLTAAIVADIVDKSAFRHGVLIFAATIQHAKEIMESLPPEKSRIVTGETSDAMRDAIVKDFKAKKFKYLVNVAVLTTGFDAPHCDVIAIMRATESVSLLQQIIGRGLRLGDPSCAGNLHAIANSSKPDCLVLDYAGNIERHCPDGDLFNPTIKAGLPAGEAEPIEAKCELCGSVNLFRPRKNEDGFAVDANGYFLDLQGGRIETENGFMPAHFGRRCGGYVKAQNAGELVRCEYRWSVKKCTECEHENDIAARFCEKCKTEIVDPNSKLAIDFARIKKDPYTPTSDRVLSWKPQEWISQSGNTTLRIDFTTEFRTFSVWYKQRADRKPGEGTKPLMAWLNLCEACGVSDVSTAEEFSAAKPTMPRTITAYKEKGSNFFRVSAYNEEELSKP